MKRIRCSRCGRVIHDKAKQIEGLGHFGGQCYSRVAAFKDYLNREGWTDLLTGLKVDLRSEEQVKNANKLIKTMAQAGIPLDRKVFANGYLMLTIGMKKSQKRAFNKALTTFQDFAEAA